MSNIVAMCDILEVRGTVCIWNCTSYDYKWDKIVREIRYIPESILNICKKISFIFQLCVQTYFVQTDQNYIVASCGKPHLFGIEV